MRTKLSAAVLALGLAMVPAGAAFAANANPCSGGDDLQATTVDTASYDLNGNGFVCAHTERYHAPKKPGPPTPFISYYDDSIQ